MNSILAVWFLFEKHSIYIELLLQERLLSSRLFAYFHSHSCHRASKAFISEYFHSHSCHRASKVFFQECSLSLSHSLLYILTRIIEHRKPFRKPCHPRDLDLPLIQGDRAYPTTVSATIWWIHAWSEFDKHSKFDCVFRVDFLTDVWSSSWSFSSIYWIFEHVIGIIHKHHSSPYWHVSWQSLPILLSMHPDTFLLDTLHQSAPVDLSKDSSKLNSISSSR